MAAVDALPQFDAVASGKQRAVAAVATLLLVVAWASCQQPIQPPVGTVEPIDASNDVRAIQSEEEQLGREVSQIARSQLGEELAVAERLVRSPELDTGALPLDGGSLSRPPEAEVAGKLERATSEWLVIRDDSGFEYWLRPSPSTQVTANGQPARLTDFKQGTEVRAEFFWKGKERIATAMDGIAQSQGRDGGLPGEEPPGS